jgi:hypothetical protein
MANYDVVLKSTSGTKLNGTNTNQMSFTFDWSVLDDKPYELSFSFLSDAFTTTTTTCSSAILSDLFLGNAYTTTTTESAPFSSVLGLIASGTGASGVSYLRAESQSNDHIYLIGRPRQNKFTISIIGLDYATLNAGLATGVNWSLCLHFKDASRE